MKRLLILSTTSLLAAGAACAPAQAPQNASTPQAGSPASDGSAQARAAGSDARSGEALERLHAEALEAGLPGPGEALAMTVDGEEPPHPVWHARVAPGQTLQLSSQTPFLVSVDSEPVSAMSREQAWTAPDQPGVHALRMVGENGQRRRLTIFVMQPYDGQTVLDGYRIGTYPQDPPEGFIRLSEADLDAPVSPSFTIGQFLCKQQPGHWPKFLLVSGSMLQRLEALLGELNTDGRTDADSFFVMSGFRTPFYNTAIGSARLSRHMYGDAADIYPDVEGGDGVMDDLNRDNRITKADATWLFDYAADLYSQSDSLPAGGIGAYGANAVHGPFVHIDGRGRAARWGRYGS